MARFTLISIVLVLMLGGTPGTPSVGAEVTGRTAATLEEAGILPNCNARLTKIVFDSAGDLYGVGSVFDYDNPSTGEDILVVKHDAYGNALWEARYDGGSNPFLNNSDYGVDIALDSSGSVYIGGISLGSETGYDFVTAKYDSDGQFEWAMRYDGPGSGQDYLCGIAVDPAGNVYVAGSAQIIGSNYDYATMKYDTDGNLLWLERYNAFWDLATKIAVDPAGNVYVTGRSYIGTATYYDYVTVKYDTDGHRLWVQKYNGPGNGNDEPVELALDEAGNVYVTGQSPPTPGSYICDYATVKYDADGNELWIRIFDGPTHHNDIPLAMTVDPDGNVYVTGYSNHYSSASANYDSLTVKYDSHGSLLWTKAYDSGIVDFSERPRSIAVDGAGNVYVAGSSACYLSGPQPDPYNFLIKYDSSGEEQWVNVNAAPYGYADGGEVVIDSEGIPCVENTFHPVRYAYGLSWYAPNGDHLRTASPYGILFDERPIADAGPDQSLVDIDLSGSESVALDGSGSYDPDEYIFSYIWRRLGREAASGVQPTLTLGLGTHDFVLEVYDKYPLYLVDYDEVRVTVEPGSAKGAVTALIDLIRSFNMQPGVGDSLVTRLRSALADVETLKIAVAIRKLEALITECEALRERVIPSSQADLIIQKINYILAFLRQQ